MLTHVNFPTLVLSLWWILAVADDISHVQQAYNFACAKCCCEMQIMAVSCCNLRTVQWMSTSLCFISQLFQTSFNLPDYCTAGFIRHASFLRHLKNMRTTNTKHAAEICGNMVQSCLKPTTASRSTGVRTHGWCHSVGNQIVEVTKSNRNR